MGILMDNSAIVAVMAILEQTPNLEILTLLIKPDGCDFGYFWNETRWEPDAVLDVPGVLPAVSCLQDRLREINVVHYQGSVTHRKLLKLLLLQALRLDEVYVVFPKARYATGLADGRDPEPGYESASQGDVCMTHYQKNCSLC